MTPALFLLILPAALAFVGVVLCLCAAAGRAERKAEAVARETFHHPV